MRRWRYQYFDSLVQHSSTSLKLRLEIQICINMPVEQRALCTLWQLHTAVETVNCVGSK